MSNLAGKLAGAGLVVAAVLGLKVYNKGRDEKKLHDHLVSLCGGEAACVQLVEQRFPTCFDRNYKMGGRRSGASLKVPEMIACLNEGLAEPMFEEKK